jgi:hypothetical protein
VTHSRLNSGTVRRANPERTMREKNDITTIRRLKMN